MPEVIEDFFVQAAPTSGIQPKETRDDSKIYRIGRVPRQLWPIGERLEPRFGKLGHEYKNVVFDKQLLPKDPTLEWVTPGHPLFEAVREDLLENAAPDLQRGSIFYDLHASAPYRLDFFAASVKDGRDNQIHRRLFAVQAEHSTLSHTLNLSVKQPTVLLDLAVAPQSAQAPASDTLPDRTAAEQFLIQTALNPMLAEVTTQRTRETQTITRHLEISLNELINRQQLRLGELSEMQERGDTSQPLAANIKQTEDRIDELNARLEHRRAELERERECMIGDIQHVARAWVLPHPERQTPQIAAMVADPEIERIAVQFAIKHEEAQGRVVESVEKDIRLRAPRSPRQRRRPPQLRGRQPQNHRAGLLRPHRRGQSWLPARAFDPRQTSQRQLPRLLPQPVIAQALATLKLMEQRGSGFARMHDAMLNHGLDAPAFQRAGRLLRRHLPRP